MFSLLLNMISFISSAMALILTSSGQSALSSLHFNKVTLKYYKQKCQALCFIPFLIHYYFVIFLCYMCELLSNSDHKLWEQAVDWREEVYFSSWTTTLESELLAKHQQQKTKKTKKKAMQWKGLILVSLPVNLILLITSSIIFTL